MIIDFHSHILPALDDGSKSVEESIGMLKLMKEQGIGAVVATPHFYSSKDHPERFFTARRESFDNLMAASKDLELPKIYLGAEVAYYRGMSRSAALKEFAVENTNAVMVEMPMTKWSDSMYEELEDIYAYQGLVPIIAHLDRYIGPILDHGIPKRLAQLNVVVQANASFFLEKNNLRKAFKLLSGDMIHLLGSDAHNLKDRAPNLGMAVQTIEDRFGREYIAAIESWQNKILNFE